VAEQLRRFDLFHFDRRPTVTAVGVRAMRTGTSTSRLGGLCCWTVFPAEAPDTKFQVQRQGRALVNVASSIQGLSAIM
jgi:hypothetical protein